MAGRSGVSVCESSSFEDSSVEEEILVTAEDMEACFEAFDKDGDGNLNLTEFGALCRALFRNDRGKPYSIEQKRLQEMFDVFDKNQDCFIDKEEFTVCWHFWIKKIVRPSSAFLIVDVQNDFISGSLAIINCPAGQEGADVIEPINRLLNTVPFDAIFYTLDWHPSNHISFVDNLNNRTLHESSKIAAEDAKVYDTVVFEGPPVNEQKLWPRHCVQETWGSELHKDLNVPEGSVLIHKGTNPEIESYSGFWDNNRLSCTSLANELQQRNITDVYVCGLAYDVCVGATAVDAIDSGYRTILVEDACRGITNEDIEKTRNRIIDKHGIISQSSQVKAMVQGRDRRPELGYKLASELKKGLTQ